MININWFGQVKYFLGIFVTTEYQLQKGPFVHNYNFWLGNVFKQIKVKQYIYWWYI